MAPKKAALSIFIKNFQSNWTCLEYLNAAKEVPEMAGILDVPTMDANGNCGNKINNAGICNKPPPPTMASIKPAKNATIQSIKYSKIV